MPDDLQSLVDELPDDEPVPDDPDESDDVDEEDALFDPNIEPDEPYDDYQCKYTYHCDEHVIQSPVASADPQAQCVVTQTGAPTWQKIVSWTAARKGRWPNVPAVETNNENLVLMHRTLEPHAPTLTGSGQQRVYRISGQYVYAMLTPFSLDDDLPTGSAPDDVGDSADMAVPTDEVFDSELNG